MKIKKIIKSTVVIVVVFLSTYTSATSYFGFNLGEQTLSQIKRQLNDSGAKFDDNYSYKGYNNILPIIKISKFKRFDKYGKLKQARLYFTSDKKLYKIDIEWNDNNSTIFKLFKNSLDLKYGKSEESNQSIDTFLGKPKDMFQKFFNYHYKDTDVYIVLQRYKPIFGYDEDVSLYYTFTPSSNKVEEIQGLIDDEIRKENIKKTMNDL